MTSRWLAAGAFACIAGCVATAALPALLGGLAGFGLRAFGWEVGLAILTASAAIGTWLYLRRRRQRALACGCAAQKAGGADAAP